MGLLDQVIGGLAGGKAQGTASSGMSPLTKALLMLLAAKAASHYMGSKPHDAAAAPSGGGGAPVPSGKIESGVLAGLPSLDSILDKFRSSGHGEKVDSWIGHGANKPIAPHELGSTLGPETIDQLQKATGLPKDQLLAQLSHTLPQVLDKLTPDGHLPKPDQRSHW